MRWKLLVLGGSICALAVSCTVGPNYKRPTMEMPARYSESGATTQSTTQAASQPSTAPAAPMAVWWHNFQDPQLDSLIERAIKSNLSLQAAEARIRQARAQYGVNAAALYPTVNASGSYTRRGQGNGSSRTFTSTSGFSTTTGGSSSTDSFQAGFDSAWEVDVFGGVRRSVEASRDNLQANIEDRRNVLITLIAEVARDYIDYRGFARQVVIAHNNADAQRRTLALTRQQFNAGLKTATELDVRRAEALVYSTESVIPVLETSQQQAAHALAFLLGLNPGALMDELGAARAIPQAMVPELPIGLPSELLRRRPDIRTAERQLAVATANIGVATADLFPRFSLTGSLGLQSSQFKSLFNYGSHFWSIGPSVSWPLFDAGRIRANINVQNALQEQSLINYRSVVLTALQEVEDSLVAFGREQVRRQFLMLSVSANRRAVELATQRYNAGLTDFLSVLDAERSLFAAEDQLVQSDRLISDDLVALYKALGGGWEVTEERAQ